MSEWILLFLHAGFIATTQPMPLADCLKWHARMKPDQKPVCIRIIQTELGPYVERRHPSPSGDKQP